MLREWVTSLCPELKQNVLSPLSRGEEPLWTIRGVKNHIATCPQCQSNLGKLRGEETEEKEIMRFLHMVGAEPIRCPFCGAVVSEFRPADRIFCCSLCKSLYLVDAACDDEDSSEDVDDLVSALPEQIGLELEYEDAILHNVIAGFCHLRGLEETFDVRLFKVCDKLVELGIPCPQLVHLHFFRLRAKRPLEVKGLNLKENQNASLLLDFFKNLC